ncbi:MAG: DUF3717 domain-containing protein [Pusillimonas sp.]
MADTIWTIQEIEEVINRLRVKSPSDGVSLAPELVTLGDLYGRMIYRGLARVAASELSQAEATILSANFR